MPSRPTRLRVRLAATTLLLISAALSATAQTADPVLAGLKGVDLGVELQHDAEARLGLSPDRAYRAIEDELRRAGIRFLQPAARRADVGGRFRTMPRGYALLYFKVAAVADERAGGSYTVDVKMDLLDLVRLSRDKSRETVASIYTARQLVLMRGRGGSEEVLDRLRAMAGEFAADFRAENPGTDRR